MEYHVDISGITNIAIPFNKWRRSKNESRINRFVKSSVKSSFFRFFHRKAMLKQLKTTPTSETTKIKEMGIGQMSIRVQKVQRANI